LSASLEHAPSATSSPTTVAIRTSTPTLLGMLHRQLRLTRENDNAQLPSGIVRADLHGDDAVSISPGTHFRAAVYYGRQRSSR
jgi:hypothetical protein